jgi:hypothetical protein
MTTSLVDYFPLDSFVQIRPEYLGRNYPAGAIYQVVDVPGGRRTKYKVQNVKTGATVNGTPGVFIAHTGPTPELPEPLPPLVLGALVEVEEGHEIPADCQYVVLGTKADGDVKIVRLGGDGNRYWTGSRRWLTELPV